MISRTRLPEKPLIILRLLLCLSHWEPLYALLFNGEPEALFHMINGCLCEASIFDSESTGLVCPSKSEAEKTIRHGLITLCSHAAARIRRKSCAGLSFVQEKYCI